MSEDVAQFFADVLADEGYYCAAYHGSFVKDGKTIDFWKHKVGSNQTDLIAFGNELVKAKKDAYFALGTLKEEKIWNPNKNNGKGAYEYRVGHNMNMYKCLFMDLDCGPSKDYANQSEGLESLKEFVLKSKFPRPTYIILSGYGLHCYWCFDQAVDADYWGQMATKFKSLHKPFGLAADKVVSADYARVLRIPDTLNFKNPDDPKKVRILRRDKVYSLQFLDNLLDEIIAENKLSYREPFKPMTPEAQALFANIKSNTVGNEAEKDISVIYRDCQQMRQNLEEGRADYIMRESWVSIIKHCKDPDYSVMLVNDNDPDTVKYQTEQMLNTSISNNPHQCSTFEDARPGGCDGCQFKGVVKSPISLVTRQLDIHNPDDQEKLAEVQVMLEQQAEKLVNKSETRTVGGKVYRIPTAPPKFSVSDQQVTYTDIIEGELVTQIVCDFMIVPVELCSNKVKMSSDSFKVFIKTGISEPRILEFPMSVMSGNDGLRKILAANSAMPSANEKSGLLYMYMNSYIKHLQNMMKPSELHGSLGWDSDDMNFFVTPNGRYMRNGDFLPSNTSGEIAQAMAPLKAKGTLEEWKAAIDFYNKDGYEDYAFGHLVGYGSLVFAFSGHSGAVVSLVGDSGSGKTTILNSINSIFGHPKNYLTQADTMNAKMNRLGVYKNYPVTYDEITNMDNDELSQFVYSVSQGRSKLRLEQTGNERSSTNNHWQMIMACTGNANLVDKLMSHKQDASPEVLRVFEYHVKRRDEIKHSAAREVFNKLANNYGHAGDIFIKYMVNHTDEIHALYGKVLAKIEEETQTMQKERFWVAIVASTIVGGIIARKLDLHSFNMNKIFVWAMKRIKDMCAVVNDSSNSPTQILSGFLNAAYNRTITVAGGVSDKSGKMTPLYVTFEPTGGEIWVRQERDRNLVFIDAAKFREYATRSQAGYSEVKKALTTSGVLINSNTNKTLSANSQKHQSGSVKCWTIDMSHKEMVGLLAPLEHKMTSIPVLDNFNTSDSAED